MPMSLIGLLALGVIFGSNNLAVSFSLGAMDTAKRHTRIILIFGFFEFFVPLAGLAIGNLVSSHIADYTLIVSSLLLVLLGLFTIYNALIKEEDSARLAHKITTFKGLVFLSLGLSLDNLVVGFSMGLKEISPILLAGIISIFSMLFSLIGLKTGMYLSSRARTTTEVCAGLLLIFLGLANYMGWLTLEV